MNSKRYSELIQIPTFDERFKYLQTASLVGKETFGSHRYLNQRFYTSDEWRAARREAIIRDNGYDLADEDHPIIGEILVHHIRPITIEDIIERRPCVLDLDNLICVSFDTHNAIHYGREGVVSLPLFAKRQKNDTCPWRY